MKCTTKCVSYPGRASRSCLGLFAAGDISATFDHGIGELTEDKHMTERPAGDSAGEPVRETATAIRATETPGMLTVTLPAGLASRSATIGDAESIDRTKQRVVNIRKGPGHA